MLTVVEMFPCLCYCPVDAVDRLPSIPDIIFCDEDDICCGQFLKLLAGIQIFHIKAQA